MKKPAERRESEQMKAKTNLLSMRKELDAEENRDLAGG